MAPRPILSALLSLALLAAACEAEPSLSYEVPMIFLMGRSDLHTPYASSRAHYDRTEAPLKRFVTFERSVHFVILEDPGRFLMTLVNEVLPLAGGAKEFAVIPDPGRRR